MFDELSDDDLLAEARRWQRGRFGTAEPVAADLIGQLADRLLARMLDADG